MASSNETAVKNIREYAVEAHERQQSQMDVDASDIETRLDATRRELEERVTQHRIALEELRSAPQGSFHTKPSDDPRERLAQLQILRDAYESLKPSVPFLPSRNSLLPSLLAARTIQQTVSGTQEAITATKEQLKHSEQLLRQEESNLHDANLIATAMANRIERLRSQKEAKSQKTPQEVAKDLIDAKQRQKERYDEEMKKLGQAFEIFVDEQLAGMLAAEDLGGPVVGDMMDVDDDVLAIGFTQQGRLKTSKKHISEPRRQKRLDEIWGDTATTEEGQQLTEIDAAGRELRELIEDLFTSLVGSRSTDAYIELERESAASRFLIRARIAQFHPKDARKLRLIDFGRELDD
ncbi:uncharacterized protein BDZ99DRAFT_379836 [Mytilinidion resinicola]|uniref:Uncharacterized protein n=1 Tax=Mytilinidion resinicola TaxID=574789 RepID=A0A6A6YXR9_9PEZI|nr:uncharacterized protein BDZ99DRAFT_379836 [Mytilinidion resinicola]KAF2813756.1 hypothetical protein BDZ99DRAFT_379836 [Mytilinidion resinicola]